jgi:hypothetical protein
LSARLDATFAHHACISSVQPSVAAFSSLNLRAKALIDKRRVEAAEATQALAGHTTAQMTVHYAKASEIKRVSPVPLNRAS